MHYGVHLDRMREAQPLACVPLLDFFGAIGAIASLIRPCLCQLPQCHYRKGKALIRVMPKLAYLGANGGVAPNDQRLQLPIGTWSRTADASKKL
jgi:hypothetical protein